MEGTSDFDDDEDFGLGAPIAQGTIQENEETLSHALRILTYVLPLAGTHTQKQDARPEEALQESMQADKANDDEEDIYGDIAGNNGT